MNDSPRRAFLVSHTHWDREWYLPYSRFRVVLDGVVGRVLDVLDADDEYRAFVMDGQTCVVEDYLAGAPEQRDRIHRFVREGRLAVGPWYILPDEFLVSGEATVRNLLLGRAAAPLGRVQDVGYMPDSFGHIAQMPQILRLAGIDSFLFTRGLGDEAPDLGWLFRWAAPDGSEVLAVNQCDGYCNAGGLGFAEIWHAHTRRRVQPELAVEKVRALFARMAERPGAEPALLNNGCDHFPPQQEFGAVLSALREAFPDTEFLHGRFKDFLAAVREEAADEDRPRHEGELLGGRDHLILSGVWSARMNLKQANERCQNLLSRVVEPLAAADVFLHGGDWPGGLLADAWRELVRNHPHDSICGCSTDEVHREMETRFASVRQVSEQLTARVLDRWTPMFAPEAGDDRETVITVANPLPFRRDEVVERLVVLQPLGYDLTRLRLVDQNGEAVPCDFVKRRFLERFWGIDYRQELWCEDQLAKLDVYLRRYGDRIIGTEADRESKDCFLHLRFLARDLPAVGHAHYFLVDDGGAPAPVLRPVAAGMADGSVRLANEHLEAVLHPDGTIDLTDRASGRVFAGLNLLEDSEDRGDEYDFCPTDAPGQIFAAGCEGRVSIVAATGLRASAEAEFRFDLPRSLTRDRRERERRTTPCDVTVRMTLDSGSRRLDIATTFNNRAFDHRLRAWFPTGIAAATVVSDGHFMLNERPAPRPASEGWDQPAPPTWPQQDFSAIGDDAGGLAVLNRGLPEFEALDDGAGGLVYALTLLRGVDWLSRDDLATRNHANAGPTLHTPDAQMIGRHTFEYAVAPFAGDVVAAGIKDESDRYRTPPPSHQGVRTGMVEGGDSLLEKADPRIAITAIKRSERGRALVLRLCNLSNESFRAALQVGRPVVDAEKVGLLETSLPEPRGEVAVTHGGNAISVPLAPHEIAVLMLML